MTSIGHKVADHDSIAVSFKIIVLGLAGHSLGGGLAILVSAALSTDPGYPVIAFGSALLSRHVFEVASFQRS